MFIPLSIVLDRCLVFIPLSRNKILLIGTKNYAKKDIKAFLSCLILFYFLTLFQILCPALSAKTNFCLELGPASFKHSCFDICFSKFKGFIKPPIWIQSNRIIEEFQIQHFSGISISQVWFWSKLWL